jgi:oligopeptide transport system permease protein
LAFGIKGEKRMRNICLGILKQFFLWMVAACILLLILLIPRDFSLIADRTGQLEEAVYHYNIKDHITNVKNFFIDLEENGGLGIYKTGDSIESHVIEMTLRSLKLIIPAILIGFFFGIVKGVFDFLVKGKRVGIGSGTTWMMLSIPDLFFMIFLQLFLMFLYQIGLFPHVDLYGHEKIDNQIVGIIFLSIYPLFFIANITYTSLVEEEKMDYINTAKSKGVQYFKIVNLHMLKNALQKIIVNSNTLTLYVLSNLFIVEYLSNYRGAAYHFLQGLYTNAAVGFVIMFTLIIFLANTFFKIIHSLISPKGTGI